MPTKYMAGKKPDYDVACLDKETEFKGRVGAAWINPDGSVSVVLNHRVSLPTQNGTNLLITLFPTTSKAVLKGVPSDKPASQASSTNSPQPAPSDDDVPF